MFYMMHYQHYLYATLILLLLTPVQVQLKAPSAPTTIKPKLQLATTYHNNLAIEDYWVSEKLDGVRGYWTGSQLITRNGHVLSTPKWFTINWPNTPMDGELWSGRGEFEQISACVRRKKTNGTCWQQLKLMIFDLPLHQKTFTERISRMEKLIQRSDSPYLDIVSQRKVTSHQQLYALLDQVVDNDGEGLMLHLSNAKHQSGRSKNVLKLKRYQDAEAMVIAHLPGKGKYKSLMGSIQVKTLDNIVFKIGSGFSDLQRQHPPKIGSIITYKYIGKTQRGVPRFASFLRVKHKH